MTHHDDYARNRTPITTDHARHYREFITPSPDMTMREAAAALHTTEYAIQAHLNRGTLPIPAWRYGLKWRFRSQDVRDYIERITPKKASQS